MATWVSFLDLKTGVAFDVNVADPNVSNLTTVPDAVLVPLGIGTGLGTYITYDTGLRVAVRGSIATTAAAFAGGGIAPSKAVYVDTAGNDATGQRGSAVFPFLTMAAAMGVVQSGDEVLVSPGTYSGAFTMANVANVIVRGAGEFAGDTILTAGNAVDVCSLAAGNRSILFDTIEISGATTGRGIVGTGATAAGAWLNSGFGLVLQDTNLISAAGNALDLTYANLVTLRNSIVNGSVSLVTCGPVTYDDTLHTGALTFSWDNTDALKPAVQSLVSLVGGSEISGTTTMTGQARLNARSNSTLGALTGNNLSVAAGPVNPSITVAGSVGAVDFQSTAAKRLPSSALGSFTVSFAGATLNGAFSVCVASGVSRQIVSLVGATASGVTITSDALCDVNARGAAFSTPTYTSANTGALGVGTIVPPYLAMAAINIAAGGAIATNFTGGFTAPAGGIAVVSQSNTGGAALAAAVSTTQVTITSTAQAGNTAAAYIVWP